MTADAVQSVLKRLMERVGESPDLSLMTPCKAMRNALPKAADHALDLPLIVSDVSLKSHTREMLLSKLEDNRLYMLIQSTDDRLGIAIPDAALLASLIEIQTIGDVSPNPPIARRPTRTDASLVEPFLDAVLAEFVHQLAGKEELPRFLGFSYSRVIEDQRHLPLVLPEDDYACFEIAVGLGKVAKPAYLILAYPSLRVDTKASEDVGPSKKWTTKLEAGVMGAEVEIDVTLHTFTMPLDEVPNLVVGYEIILPRMSVNTLKVKGSDGSVVAQGSLGQSNGFRAVKISGGEGAKTAQSKSSMAQMNGNPLEAMGPVDGPIPVTATDAVLPMDTGVPKDFSDMSPPDEVDEPDDGLGDFRAMDDFPSMSDLPPMDNLPPMGDLPDLDFEMDVSPIQID
ncbi:FliM/FliN family flagellar motor C-terminal domain-containing protein [Falsihalocynthiibacter arcticus]|uniref:FliM/FliN family flagellar motor C-terminal domain-containing protein n=1 Tax=Falsihalocynthiibacter arcticus TaxID=1579316 RepID=UPI00300385E4